MGINCSENRTADDGGKGLSFFFFFWVFFFYFVFFWWEGRTKLHRIWMWVTVRVI